jgi:hypothetical protein
LKKNAEKTNLQALQKEVYALNATEYFSKPGPRTIIGLEIFGNNQSFSVCRSYGTA